MATFSVSVKTPEDKQFCIDSLKQFQTDRKLTTQGEAIITLFELTSTPEAEIISPEQKDRMQQEKTYAEALMDVCDRGLLSIIGSIPVCGQHTFPKGIQSQQFFTYPRGHTLEKQTMSVEDIIKTCDLCKQSFSEDSRIRDIMKKMSMMLEKNQKIELFFCKHDELSQQLFTAFREATFPCPISNRYVTVEKTCLLKGCNHLTVQHIDAPPMKVEDKEV